MSDAIPAFFSLLGIAMRHPSEICYLAGGFFSLRSIYEHFQNRCFSSATSLDSLSSVKNRQYVILRGKLVGGEGGVEGDENLPFVSGSACIARVTVTESVHKHEHQYIQVRWRTAQGRSYRYREREYTESPIDYNEKELKRAYIPLNLRLQNGEIIEIKKPMDCKLDGHRGYHDLGEGEGFNVQHLFPSVECKKVDYNVSSNYVLVGDRVTVIGTISIDEGSAIPAGTLATELLSPETMPLLSRRENSVEQTPDFDQKTSKNIAESTKALVSSLSESVTSASAGIADEGSGKKSIGYHTCKTPFVISTKEPSAYFQEVNSMRNIYVLASVLLFGAGAAIRHRDKLRKFFKR